MARKHSIDGEWLTNNQPILYTPRLAHFVELHTQEAYCNLISAYHLDADFAPDRACLRCIMYLYRDGFLRFSGVKVPRVNNVVMLHALSSVSK